MKADRDREGKLDHRRHTPRGDVFHPLTEHGVSRQVQLPRQRRVKIHAVAAVRPVVGQIVRIDQLLDILPRTNMPQLFPPLLRQDLAVSIGGLVPGQAEIADRRNQRCQGDHQDDQRAQADDPGRIVSSLHAGFPIICGGWAAGRPDRGLDGNRFSGHRGLGFVHARWSGS